MQTTNEIVKILNPEKVLVFSSNYLQCIISGQVVEAQKCYKSKKWYLFKSGGRADSPTETFLKYIEPKEYQPKTGAKCRCRPGIMRDNCPACEGTGYMIDFAKIRARS